MAKFRAVVFDFGGVLVRMVDERPRRELADRLGVTLSSLDELVYYSPSAQKASRGEFTVEQHWQAVGQKLGIPPHEMPAFLEQYWSADDVNWSLLDYIRNLRPRYKVGLLSNAWDNLRQTMHDRWGMDSLFDEMVISAEVGVLKPDPRIFHLMAERLGVEPASVVFIDDTPLNVDAARQQGMSAIQFIDTEGTLAALGEVLGEIIPPG